MDLDFSLERAAKVLDDAECAADHGRVRGWASIRACPISGATRGSGKPTRSLPGRGLSFVEMANPDWFHRDPGLAWAFYGHRLNLYRKTRPHVGFHILLEPARKMPAGYFVFTSNVDGHFQKAGFDPERIEECHGSIHRLQCVQECSALIWDAEGTEGHHR